MTRSNKKIIKPLNPLIYKVAASMAAELYEVGRSQGMQSRHKTPRAYAKANLEKFVPLAIKHLLSMLKSTSNCSEHMRQEIYKALTDPINDPNLMEAKVDTDLNMSFILDQKKFEKMKILAPVSSTPAKTVLHR